MRGPFARSSAHAAFAHGAAGHQETQLTPSKPKRQGGGISGVASFRFGDERRGEYFFDSRFYAHESAPGELTVSYLEGGYSDGSDARTLGNSLRIGEVVPMQYRRGRSKVSSTALLRIDAKKYLGASRLGLQFTEMRPPRLQQEAVTKPVRIPASSGGYESYNESVRRFRQPMTDVMRHLGFSSGKATVKGNKIAAGTAAPWIQVAGPKRRTWLANSRVGCKVLDMPRAPVSWRWAGSCPS